MTNEIKLTIKLEDETEITLSITEARELYAQLHKLFGDCSTTIRYPMVSYWGGLADCSKMGVGVTAT